ADLDISSQTNWGSSSNYAVGNSTNSFKANYDGDNHFVKLNIVSCSTANDTYGYALFGIAGNSNTIKNLTVKGSVASNDRMGVLGGLVGRVTGSMTFENCTNEATITSTYGTTTLDKFGFGGICGIVNANGCDVVFRNCTNQGTITEKQNCAGGICGNIISCNSCKFINCRNGLDKNKITDYKISSTNGSYIGGICGYVQKATTPVEFNSCYNNYSLNNTRYVGGILGYAKSECVFMSCHNYKSITATATDKTSYCGGIIGYSSAALSFSRGNTNEANLIVGGSNVGGIVGYINGGLLTISDSARNSGNIVSSASPAASSNRGGIVGYAYSGVDLTNCKNTGTVAGNQYLAGIVGWLGTKCTMNGCSNENTIQQTETSALSNIGGLIGFASGVTGGFIVKNCYNTGDITGKSICGGLIGYLYFSSSPNSIYTNIYNCYCSNCNITATSSNSYAGGIIGQYRTGGTSYYNLAIHNCYVSPTMTSGSGVYKGVLFGTYNSSYKAYTENNYYASTMGATAKQGASSSSTIAFNTADYSISSTTINGNPYTDVVDALNAARNAIVEGTSLYTGQSSLSLADLKGWKESNGEIVFN
ncbi:MAG: Fibronectin type III domain protein, partial [bacterium P3]